MKHLIITTCTLCCLLALPVSGAEDNTSSPETVDFGTFAPSEKGTFVEIKVNSSLIHMAARLAQDSEPEMARILGGLKSVRVNVMGFEEDERETFASRIQSIRKQLEDQQWDRVVRVQEETEDVGIYAKLNGDESIEGLVVTVINGREAVLIHVNGSIRPEELARVGERLNLEPLKQLPTALGHTQRHQ